MVIIMNELKFAGAKWWKFDFHTHTPKSRDFSKEDKDMSTESWLKAFMTKEIDCVAITDHNSGEWVNSLKETYNRLQENKPSWFRRIYLFPGVEISAYDNVHILAIFGSDKGENNIDSLLDAVKYNGKRGDTDGVTDKSVIDVVNEIAERDGIPIPAHVDKEANGLFKLKGHTLEQIVANENIHAMEICDRNCQKPQVYTKKKDPWTEIISSDVHDFNEKTFGTFTWVKMDEPSIEGLRLALQDGDVSVNRNMNEKPNKLPTYFIEKLKINDAKYIGQEETLECNFSPFLNAIIGGRGSGKSTLLEFIRLVLRRDNDIHNTLKEDSNKYYSLDENDSLLTPNTKISLLYWKNSICYRLNWSLKGDNPSLEQKNDNGPWEPFQGEIKTLFPVRIYSQKEIFELAKEPSKLIEIIDEVVEVDAENIKTKIREGINRYKQKENNQQELKEKIDQENRLIGELNDLTTQIEYIEKSGHKEVMEKYRQRQQQLNEIETLENKWKEAQHHLLDTLKKITPPNFNTESFSENSAILSDLQKTNAKWWAVHNKLENLRQEAESILTEWQTEKEVAPWMHELKSDIERYEQSSSELKQQDIDPNRYNLLLTQQKSIQKELDQISEHRSRLQTLETEKKEDLDRVKTYRKTLSRNRQDFLNSILQDNQYVNIKVFSLGESWDNIEKKLRSILQCPDHFDKDFEKLQKIYEQGVGSKVNILKKTITAIRSGDRDAEHKSFATRLQSLPQESITNLMAWLPEDNLEITYGSDSQRLEQGSPGQKNATLLAFILSYGNEPLLLDQPEDDLDNELISDLIVQQLREIKTERQVIVVTHNANIVVNGNAEMVLPLKVKTEEGKTQTEVQHPASIQRRKVRESICNILEGGEKAFEQRYKRIHLGD